MTATGTDVAPVARSADAQMRCARAHGDWRTASGENGVRRSLPFLRLPSLCRRKRSSFGTTGLVILPEHDDSTCLAGIRAGKFTVSPSHAQRHSGGLRRLSSDRRLLTVAGAAYVGSCVMTDRLVHDECELRGAPYFPFNCIGETANASTKARPL